MGKSLIPTSGSLALRGLERRAGHEIARTRTVAAVVADRQIVKTDVIAAVTRTAIENLGDIALTAEYVIQRTPGFAPEAVHIARQGAQALGNVVRQTERELW